MTADLLLALVVFAFVTSATPGPNNAMVLASGATFGFRRTVPHMLGIAVGFAVMLMAVGLGLGSLFEAVPALYDVLQVVGVAYLLVLAWRIGTADPAGGGERTTRPLGFLGAAAFQWVNPKAWIIAVAAMTAYAPQDGYAVNVLVVALVFGLVSVPSVAAWAGFGTVLARLVRRPGRVRAINVAMAALLVLSLAPLALDLLA